MQRTHQVDAVEELLRSCAAAHRRGMNFPAVWLTILRPNSLVVGMPIQRIENGEALLEIHLTTGQRIVCGGKGYLLA